MTANTTVSKRDLFPHGRRNPLILAFVLQAGGTAKTTSTVMLGTSLALRGYTVRIFDMDAQCNASEILCRGPQDLTEDQKTIWHLIQGETTLDEVTVPARMWNGEKPADWKPHVDGEYEEFAEIPNLSIVPGDEEMKNCETLMAQEPDSFSWFWELIGLYRSGELVADENEVWLLDLPANFGRITVSILYAMDEDDEVIPPVLVTGKEATALDKVINHELPFIVQKYKNRAASARPRVHHVLLCATPTSSHNSYEYRKTVEMIEAKYPDLLLPKIHFSTVVAGQYRRRCPVRITDPNSRPSKDYESVADALGFPDLEPA